MKSSYIGLVCARGGSKGLPGKNKKILAGKSLVGHAVSKAKAIDRISSVIVSTDCFEIAQLAKLEGGEVPFMRPDDLSQDTSSEWDVWRHIVNYKMQELPEFNALVVVPPTAPLRSEEDINACLDLFETHQYDIVITVTDSARSPYFNMVKDIGNGCVDLVVKPENSITRRQDVPNVYDVTTVAYVVSPHYVLTAGNLFEGRVGYVHVPCERAVDIDTQLDFDFAELIAGKAGY